MSEMDKNNFWRLKSFEVRLLVPIINLTPPLCFAKVFLYEHNAKKCRTVSGCKSQKVFTSMLKLNFETIKVLTG